MSLFGPNNPSNPFVIPVLAMQGDLQRFLDEGWDLAWVIDQYTMTVPLSSAA